MNGTATRFLRLGVSLSGLVVLGWVLTGQAAKPARHGIPLPTDWSHSHVIFSRPASAEQLASVSEDPRYWQQLHRREQSLVLSPEASDLTSVRFQAGSSAASDGLWSEDLGNLASAGAENYPAKFSFSSTTANCGSATTPDYVVYSTGKLGSGTQASVVAFDNLYTGCGGTVPTVYWAYNTGGQILTSPVPSLDGTQVAFAQTSGSPTGVAGLLLLKWKASASETVGSPGVPTSVTNAQYPTCVAPCMTEVFLHDGNGVATDDRTSSPFYDYTNDIAWVGGGNGWLHKLTGVFKGTPTEVHGGGFPVQVQPNNPNTLSDPVYDHTSKNVFVGDEGGYLHRVASATGATTISGQLDWGAGLVESPILDQTNGLVYVFASSDGISEGDIVLFGRDRRLFVHRVVTGSQPQNAEIVTRGDAMPAPDPPVSESDLLGRVSFILRDGKCIEPSRSLRFSERAVAALVRRSAFAARVVVRVHCRRQTFRQSQVQASRVQTL